MRTVGIICEYNPLHLGHQKQLDFIRQSDPDCAIICLMSGNYVQRGAPAVFHRSLRAKAAVLSGADLVLELPVTVSLSSAEGFAAGGVRILSDLCDELCFGAETADAAPLLDTARTLLSDAFPPALRLRLDEGLSFPAARAAALADLGLDSKLLATPNNILAVEYCKAILSQNSPMHPLPIHREGNYHDELPDAHNPSATAVRKLILSNHHWKLCIPAAAQPVFDSAAIHSLITGERAILSRLRTMTDQEFEALPYGSEGLWRKLMHSARREATLEQIATATKSKRYTRSRIDRMILCGFLGLNAQDLVTPPPYARVLAFNHRGREVLNKAKNTGLFPNIGEKTGHPYETIESRCDALYGLFALEQPEPPAENDRIYYHR